MDKFEEMIKSDPFNIEITNLAKDYVKSQFKPEFANYIEELAGDFCYTLAILLNEKQ